MRATWRKMKLPTMAEKNAEKVSETVARATDDGDIPVMKALRSILRWRTTTWWENRSAWVLHVDPRNVSTWKHQRSFHNRCVVSDIPMARWSGQGKHWVQEMTMHPLKVEEVIVALLTMTRQPTKHEYPAKQTRDLNPMVLEAPGKGVGIQVEIRCESKTVVDGIIGEPR